MADRRVNIVLKAKDEASKVFDNVATNTLPQFAKRVAQTLTAFASVAAIEGTLRRAVTAALDAEKATAGLTAALRAQGVSAVEALPGLKDHAEALSRLALADDEAVQGAQKVLISIGGLLGPKLEAATKAALDLSAGLGVDLEQAATMIGKAAQGSTKEFSRLGFEFQKNATDAQKLDVVLAGVQQRFGGMAEAEIKTASGQLHELNESFGELLETLGTKMIGGAAGVSRLTKLFQDLNDEANKPHTMGFWMSISALFNKRIGPAGIAADIEKAAKATEDWANAGEDAGDPINRLAANAARVAQETALWKKADADWAKVIERNAAEAQKQVEALAAVIARVNADTSVAVFAPQQRQPKPSIATGSVPGTIAGIADDAANVAAVSAADVDATTASVEAQAEAWAQMEQIITQANDGLIKYGETLDFATTKAERFAADMDAALGQAMQQAAAQLGHTIVAAAFGAEVSWREAIGSIVQGFVDAIVQALILKAVTSIVGGFSGGGVVGGATFSSGSIAYAAGGMFVPRGTDTVPAMLTPGEIVIPRGVSQSILGGRAAIVPAGGGGAGGGHVINIYALDGDSVERVLTRNPRALRAGLDHMSSRGY